MSERLFPIAMAAVVAVAIALAVVVLEPPSLARARRLDERRAQDLSWIARGLDVYWTRKHALPSDLATLARERDFDGYDAGLTDPVDRSAYEYRITGERAYDLCATFETESEPTQAVSPWHHPAGRYCFSLEARQRE